MALRRSHGGRIAVESRTEFCDAMPELIEASLFQVQFGAEPQIWSCIALGVAVAAALQVGMWD